MDGSHLTSPKTGLAKWYYLAWGGIAVLVALCAVVKLDSVPPLWWDEGWTLTVARNWVENGHYGMMKAGKPAPPDLAAAWPTTGLVALSFRLLGVGVRQGRIVGQLCMALAVVLVYYLTRLLYGKRAAWAAVFALFFLAGDRDVHFLIRGRQVLAEPVMLLALLAGYIAFARAFRRPAIWLPLCSLFWGFALLSKQQPLPFWLLSLGLATLVSFGRRERRATRLLVASLLASLIWHGILRVLPGLMWHAMPAERAVGLWKVTAFVPITVTRILSLPVFLAIGLPTMAGLVHAGRRWHSVDAVQSSEIGLLKIALLTFVGSWTAWYLLASAGWLRYFFPAIFLGSPFVGAWFDEITRGWSWKGLAHTLAARRFVPTMWIPVLVVSIYLPLTVSDIWESFSGSDRSVYDAAEFLNSRTGPDTLVETYDSELFFLLKYPYHYPPNAVSVQLAERMSRNSDCPIDYDPLASDPDYLVVGPFSRATRLYDEVLRSGAFRPVACFGRRYEVYERVRQPEPLGSGSGSYPEYSPAFRHAPQRDGLFYSRLRLRWPHPESTPGCEKGWPMVQCPSTKGSGWGNRGPFSDRPGALRAGYSEWGKSPARTSADPADATGHRAPAPLGRDAQHSRPGQRLAPAALEPPSGNRAPGVRHRSREPTPAVRVRAGVPAGAVPVCLAGLFAPPGAQGHGAGVWGCG